MPRSEKQDAWREVYRHLRDAGIYDTMNLDKQLRPLPPTNTWAIRIISVLDIMGQSQMSSNDIFHVARLIESLIAYERNLDPSKPIRKQL